MRRVVESLRTLFVTDDPGLDRLRLASATVASIVLAAGVTAILRASVLTSEPITIVMFAGVLAMISNLVVNEPSLARQRITTALMALPAIASVAAGSALSSTRVIGDAVFVVVMVGAVYVRRYGPRGFALGMAAFMPFFFTQFLQVRLEQAPVLFLAVVVGLASTLLLRTVVFAERPERTLRRVIDAFRARALETVRRVDEALAVTEGAAANGPRGDRDHDEAAFERLYQARRRLNQTALLVEDQLERTEAGRVWPGLDNDVLALRIVDIELALERLGVTARRMSDSEDQSAGDQLSGAGVHVALHTGVGHLERALERDVPRTHVLSELDDARGAVAGLVAETEPGHERVQRVAFAVRRVADSIEYVQRDAPADPQDRVDDGVELPALRPPPPNATDGSAEAEAPAIRPEGDQERGPDSRGDQEHGAESRGDQEDGAESREDQGARGTRSAGDEQAGMLMTTRQSVQVGVGTTLAIVGGELLAPARWYWAAITAFVVFANTQSRGDLLSRGWSRLLGTAAGVVAGMGLGALTSGHTLASTILLMVCVFLTVYLARVSPGLMAFWITAVLALLYGLIGQFSLETLVERVEETAIGVVASVLAAFLVLPKGTREAFGEATDAFVDVVTEVLDGAIGVLLGRPPATSPLERARDMDTALATLRDRARPLLVRTPRRRGRSSHRRGLRVMVIVDHYVRALARVALDPTVTPDRGWDQTLRPALDAVRGNLDGLRDVIVRGKRRSDGAQVSVGSAEEAIDRAEAYAAAKDDPKQRRDALVVTRLLRRVDQAVVALAVDLGAARDEDDTEAERADARMSG